MAAGSLLTLLDDIATLLDDVSVMSKIALKKTAGVLGDDLALNAEQVTGVNPDRELPVVWAVAKGSFLNKLILVPVALGISALAPWLIQPLLMLGGLYLVYEGAEKVLHKLLHTTEEKEHKEDLHHALLDPEINLVELEKKKIKGAILTDFVLSAEIIVIALGVVKDSPLQIQTLVVSAIAVLITIFIYGVVAAIVKLDDLGLALIRGPLQTTPQRIRAAIGRALLWFAPALMKTLAFIGTLAMFLVGGGILLHGIAGSHSVTHAIEEFAGQVPQIGGALKYITFPTISLLFGFTVGLTAVGIGHLFSKARKLFGKKKPGPVNKDASY